MAGVYLPNEELARRQEARGTYVPTDLEPGQVAQFSAQKSRNQLAYKQALEQGEFANRANMINYTRFERPNLVQQLAAERAKLPGGFAARGLLDSGIYRSALQNFQQNRTRQLDAQQTAYFLKAAEGAQGIQHAKEQFFTAEALRAQQEQAARAALAAQIRGIV